MSSFVNMSAGAQLAGWAKTTDFQIEFFVINFCIDQRFCNSPLGSLLCVSETNGDSMGHRPLCGVVNSPGQAGISKADMHNWRHLIRECLWICMRNAIWLLLCCSCVTHKCYLLITVCVSFIAIPSVMLGENDTIFFVMSDRQLRTNLHYTTRFPH